MGEKKELKVKLSTVVFLFIILILMIALGVTYYLGFIKDKSDIKGEILNNNKNGKIKEESNKKEETYSINMGTYALDKEYAKTLEEFVTYDSKIEFYGDNSCSIYEGEYVYEGDKYNNIYKGTYYIDNDVVTCNMKNSLSFEFKIIDKNIIELCNTSVKTNNGDPNSPIYKIGTRYVVKKQLDVSTVYENENKTTANKGIDEFKIGKYTYSFTSKNDVNSYMSLIFKNDNTMILVPPFSEDAYLIGTYEVKYQEEGRIDLPGNIYIIKCTFDKWSADNLNNVEQKAYASGNAEIIILDDENIMIYYMEPIEYSKGNYGHSFGEGVRFTLEK